MRSASLFACMPADGRSFVVGRRYQNVKLVFCAALIVRLYDDEESGTVRKASGVDGGLLSAHELEGGNNGRIFTAGVIKPCDPVEVEFVGNLTARGFQRQCSARAYVPDDVLGRESRFVARARGFVFLVNQGQVGSNGGSIGALLVSADQVGVDDVADESEKREDSAQRLYCGGVLRKRTPDGIKHRGSSTPRVAPVRSAA